MGSKAPSYGCHGEPGTAAVPEEGVEKKKEKNLVGYGQASLCRQQEQQHISRR